MKLHQKTINRQTFNKQSGKNYPDSYAYKTISNDLRQCAVQTGKMEKIMNRIVNRRPNLPKLVYLIQTIVH